MSTQYKRKPRAERRMKARRERRKQMAQEELRIKITEENKKQREADADRIIAILEEFIDARAFKNISPSSAERLRAARQALKDEILGV